MVVYFSLKPTYQHVKICCEATECLYGLQSKFNHNFVASDAQMVWNAVGSFQNYNQSWSAQTSVALLFEVMEKIARSLKL